MNLGVTAIKPQDLTWDRALRLFGLRCRSQNLTPATLKPYTVNLTNRSSAIVAGSPMTSCSGSPGKRWGIGYRKMRHPIVHGEPHLSRTYRKRSPNFSTKLSEATCLGTGPASSGAPPCSGPLPHPSHLPRAGGTAA